MGRRYGQLDAGERLPLITSSRDVRSPRCGVILRNSVQTVSTARKGIRARIAGLLIATVVTGVLLPRPSMAQDLEPRAYANTPVGMNFLLLGYKYTRGDVAFDPSLPIEDGEVTVQNLITAYVRSLSLFGQSAKLQLVAPYVWVSGSARMNGMRRERSVSGFGDPSIRLAMNFYGAPALSLEDFGDYEQDLILGGSLRVTAPGEQYDDDKLVNIGTNRWSVKPEVGFSKRIDRVTLELSGGIVFYTDNDDFLGGSRLEQDPIYTLQTHVIYSFLPGLWGALNATFYGGGRTTIDGKTGEDLGEARLGGTLSVPLSRAQSIVLSGSATVSSRSGSSFDTMGAFWQYKWGGGL